MRRALLIVGLCIAASSADAASRICRDLETRLAQSGSGASGSLGARYARAIDEQQRQLSRALRQERRLGCRYGDDPQCLALDDTISRMERNLADLTRTQRRLTRNDDGGARTRKRLLARLEAYGCRGEGRRTVERRQPEQQRRKAPKPVEEEQAALAPPRAPTEPAAPPAAFRTLCVRTCDGYFFPMSYAASAENFTRDQVACEAACPGTDVKLYIYRTADQEPEAMVAASGGTAYRDLPTAFRYRDAAADKPQGCGCGGKARNFSIVAGDSKAELPASAPLPEAKPSGSDPESAPGPSRPPAAPAGEAKDRKVRVVGPSFLPDPPSPETQPPRPTP